MQESQRHAKFLPLLCQNHKCELCGTIFLIKRPLYYRGWKGGWTHWIWDFFMIQYQGWWSMSSLQNLTLLAKKKKKRIFRYTPAHIIINYLSTKWNEHVREKIRIFCTEWRKRNFSQFHEFFSQSCVINEIWYLK